MFFRGGGAYASQAMRFQARGILAILLVVAILGGVALVLAGLLAALAVAIPAAIVATLIFGKRVEGER